MIGCLLDILSIVKIYHLFTKNGYKHKISGKLYEKLSELFDLYMETYIGYNGEKTKIGEGLILANFDDEDFVTFLENLEEQLDEYTDPNGKKSLITILDDCRVELRHYIYLLRKS